MSEGGFKMYRVKKADTKKRLELILPLYSTTTLKTIQTVKTKVFHICSYENRFYFD